MTIVNSETSQSALIKSGIPRTIVGYCWPWTLRPGDNLDFMVSAHDKDSYQADLVRIICADNLSDPTMFKEEVLQAPFTGTYPGHYQPTDTGSYIEVEAHQCLDDLNCFTVQALVFPTYLSSSVVDDASSITPQHLVSRWDQQTQKGWALLIDEQSRLVFLLGDGSKVHQTVLDRPLIQDRWFLIAASYNADTRQIHIRACLVSDSPSEKLAWPASEAGDKHECGLALVQQGVLRFAACTNGPGHGVREKPSGCFNGRMDRIRVTAGILDTQQIGLLSRAELPAELNDQVIGFWDFAKGIDTTTIYDLSDNGLHGVTINLPTRATFSVDWDGSNNDWRQCPNHYSAIHFHDDDLYDAEWDKDFSLKIPKDFPSGIYAARLRQNKSEDYIPFFVAPPQGKANAKIALLLSTTTYTAYANSLWNHSWEKKVKSPEGNWTVEVKDQYPTVLRCHEAMAFLEQQLDKHELGRGVYLKHTDGSHCTVASQKYPNMTIKPKVQNYTLVADTYIVDWLEHLGIDYDIITDDLLQEEGAALLNQYQVVMTGNHPEYCSAQMLDAIAQYQEEGGRWMYLGGNGFFWATSYHSQLPGAIEVRKDMLYTGIHPVHERQHAFDGQHGGQWSNNGRCPQALMGVGSVLPFPFEGSAPYSRLPDSYNPRAAFIFDNVANKTFGDFGIIGQGAAGQETDKIDGELGTPSHTLHLARSEDFPWPLSGPDGLTGEEYRSNIPMPRADMVFFETPNDGAVFSVGSMAWVGALSHSGYNNDIARITQNVLRRFADNTAFDYISD